MLFTKTLFLDRHPLRLAISKKKHSTNQQLFYKNSVLKYSGNV